MKTKKTKVGEAIVDFSTLPIAQVFKLSSGGLTLYTLPDFTHTKAEDIFECGINWFMDEKKMAFERSMIPLEGLV